MTSEPLAPLDHYQPGVPPEDRTLFRLGQLLLLLAEVPSLHGLGIERLGFYDFFAANPFLVLGPTDEAIVAELHLAGFDERQLSYASVGARFANRRKRLQHDLALLIAYGLVEVRGKGYGLSEAGKAVREQLTTAYGDAYTTSAAIVIRRLGRLSDTGLAKAARTWLREPTLLLDLYGIASGDELSDAEG